MGTIKETEMKQQREFEDVMLAAYLDTRGFHIRPVRLRSGRVSFEVSGADLDAAVDEYYTNPSVRILTFGASYKRIKTLMYEAKV